jgi:hypothetical protein
MLSDPEVLNSVGPEELDALLHFEEDIRVPDHISEGGLDAEENPENGAQEAGEDLEDESDAPENVAETAFEAEDGLEDAAPTAHEASKTVPAAEERQVGDAEVGDEAAALAGEGYEASEEVETPTPCAPAAEPHEMDAGDLLDSQLGEFEEDESAPLAMEGADASGEVDILEAEESKDPEEVDPAPLTAEGTGGSGAPQTLSELAADGVEDGVESALTEEETPAYEVGLEAPSTEGPHDGEENDDSPTDTLLGDRDGEEGDDPPDEAVTGERDEEAAAPIERPQVQTRDADLASNASSTIHQDADIVDDFEGADEIPEAEETTDLEVVEESSAAEVVAADLEAEMESPELGEEEGTGSAEEDLPADSFETDGPPDDQPSHPEDALMVQDLTTKPEEAVNAADGISAGSDSASAEDFVATDAAEVEAAHESRDDSPAETRAGVAEADRFSGGSGDLREGYEEAIAVGEAPQGERSAELEDPEIPPLGDGQAAVSVRPDSSILHS